MLKDCCHKPLENTKICTTCPKPDDWQSHASCLDFDPEIWFPEEDHSLEVKRAIKICMGCPVRGFCLEEGWTNRFGIWGSFTPLQRERLRKIFQLPKDAVGKRRVIRTIAYRL